MQRVANREKRPRISEFTKQYQTRVVGGGIQGQRMVEFKGSSHDGKTYGGTWLTVGQVIPTPSHLLDRISPIFPPFFPVFLRVFTVSPRRL